MEEKNYKNFIEQGMPEREYSLEEILAEYNTDNYNMSPEAESLSERSKRIVLEAIDDAVGQSSMNSIDDIVEDTVSKEIARTAAEVMKKQKKGKSQRRGRQKPLKEPSTQESEAPTAEFPAVKSESKAKAESPDEEKLRYSVRELEDTNVSDTYAEPVVDDYPEPYDIDEDGLNDEPEHGAGKKKAARKRGALSPMIALLALLTSRHNQRSQADDIRATPDEEDADVPEMEPERAAKFYSGQSGFLKLRGKVAAGVCLVMLYITLAFDSFLPLAGALRGCTACSLVLLIMLLTVMLCGLDVFTAGLMSLVRGRPNADSLVSISCVMACADALIIGVENTAAFGLPFCTVSAVSMCFSIWGAYFTCEGLRRSFKISASKKASAITAENGMSAKSSALIRSERGISGAVRRSETADLTEYVYNMLAPVLIAVAIVLGALASFFHGQSGAFVHCMSVMLAVSAAFSAGICFALPFAINAKKLYAVGAAICGWAGVRDIGRSRNVVIKDSDIFPRDAMEISTIRVLEGATADKVISYTGSVIAASGNGMAAAFTDLLSRNGYSLCKVENFQANDGGGMTAVVNGELVMVGSTGFMNLMGIRVPQKIATRDTVFTAVNGRLVGIFNIDYKVTPAVQDALGLLQRTRREPIFALRDFNFSPTAIENKFHLPADRINFPSFSERFRISGAVIDNTSPVAAVVCRDGMIPITELSERGGKLYLGVVAGTAIAAAAAVIGAVIMFVNCWQGNFVAGSAASALLWMLVSLLPEAGICFWLQR